eukprot:TRINITY_DN5896_c0_g3_i6.p1 TRINITY_DN5896_c0_g3~~TRINITY_DN5896_c0_g3_i6.p1  ORF type:complete len:325 (+),score=69.16 TRINITY_DN5896_c0_g3_i6:84-977(+)
MSEARRSASHAGSWYSSDSDILSSQLSGWLSLAEESKCDSPARAIISPHAGYSYSGPTAAYSFAQIDPTLVKRVFILGPSHHVYTEKCLLSTASIYETPLGNIRLDTEVINELLENELFEAMEHSVDEDEHSIEMQLPYLVHVMKGHEFRVVPIMVGCMSGGADVAYATVLARYLDDPHSLFIISSDFCHYGKRFRYTYYDPSQGAVWQSIQALDQLGMDFIQAQDADGFVSYLREYKNTICGRYPITVFLQMLKLCNSRFSARFLHYKQSNQCQTRNDSSVSYAAAVFFSVGTRDV